jgi:hypothetical protein
MTSVTGWKRGRGGDEVRAFSEGKMGRRRGSSTVLQEDDTAKSDAAARKPKGGGWRLEVGDDQRKLG